MLDGLHGEHGGGMQVAEGRFTSGERTDKPWGHEELWACTDGYAAKLLFIRAGGRLSLQHHQVKVETLLVLDGELEVQLEDDSGTLVTRLHGPGDVVHVAPGRRHRFAGITDVRVVEVSTPELDDVVRHADDYGRVGG